MEKNKINLFNTSGCLSREAILAWQGKTLSVAENYLVKEHLKWCAICNDAIEGFSNQTTRELHKNFSDISYAMQQKLIKPKSNVSRKMKLSLAAAIFLTLIGIFSLFRLLPVKESVPVAQEITPEIIQKSTPVISSNREITVPTQSKPKAEVKDIQAEEKTVVTKKADTKEEASTDPVAQSEAEVAEIPQVKSEQVSESQENKVLGYASEQPFMAKRSKAASASGVRYSEKTVAVDYNNNNETTYYAVEHQAQFEGGDINKFKAWVEQKIKTGDKDKLTTGSITLTLTVDSNGLVKDVVVVKGLDPKTDSTAVSMVKKSPKWQPAKQKGKAVNVNLVLPLNVTN